MEAEFVRRRKQKSITANTTFAKKDVGTCIDNAGAPGAAVAQLPLDATPGDLFHAYVDAAQTLTIKAGTGGIFKLSGTALTAGHGISSATAGDYATLECTAALTWRVVNLGGSQNAGHWVDQA